MAGTPNRNPQRPRSGGTQRPVSGGNRRSAPQGARRPQSAGARRPQSGARRPQSRRRPTRRRRYTPFYMRPGFWLFACIAIILLILIFKGCGGGEGKTEATENSGPIIYGNVSEMPTAPKETEPDVKPTDKPNNGPDTAPSEEPSEPPASTPTQGSSEKPTEPTEPVDPNKTYGTHRVVPGIYLLGDDLAGGRVSIEIASGSGSVRTSDGTLSIPSADVSTDKLSSVTLTPGQYLAVTGDLKLTVVYYTEKQIVSSLPRPMVKGDAEPKTLGEAGSDFEYYVMSEGGDLTPGIYQVQIYEGMGVINMPDPVTGINADFTVGTYDGYNKIIDYVKVKEGDTVTVKGCMVEFIEMEE